MRAERRGRGGVAPAPRLPPAFCHGRAAPRNPAALQPARRGRGSLRSCGGPPVAFGTQAPR
eukprot:9919581-Lingulodinium_polyedra.AAC.1